MTVKLKQNPFKIAVITPYHTEDAATLERMRASVVAQTVPCVHYMIADGHPSPDVIRWHEAAESTLRHIILPREHTNNGNTPRAIGCFSAMAEGVDAIAFLDADNWYEPDHLEKLVAEHQATGADVVTSGRVIHAIDGTPLPVLEQDEGARFFDTSTIMVTVGVFGVLPLWGTMPRELGPNCERFMFHAFKAHGCTHSHAGAPTLHFTSRYAPHYRAAGLPIPEDATAMHGMKRSTDFLRRLPPDAIKYLISARHFKALVAARAETPLIVLATPDIDTALLDQLRTAPDVEVHPCDPSTVLDDRPFMETHNNVFLLINDTDPHAAEIAQKALWILPVIFRTSPGDVDALIDRQGWRIIVDDEATLNRYRTENHFGAGHVLTAGDDLATRLHADMIADCL